MDHAASRPSGHSPENVRVRGPVLLRLLCVPAVVEFAVALHAAAGGLADATDPVRWGAATQFLLTSIPGLVLALGVLFRRRAGAWFRGAVAGWFALTALDALFLFPVVAVQGGSLLFTGPYILPRGIYHAAFVFLAWRTGYLASPPPPYVPPTRRALRPTPHNLAALRALFLPAIPITVAAFAMAFTATSLTSTETIHGDASTRVAADLLAFFFLTAPGAALALKALYRNPLSSRFKGVAFSWCLHSSLFMFLPAMAALNSGRPHAPHEILQMFHGVYFAVLALLLFSSGFGPSTSRPRGTDDSHQPKHNE